MSVSWAEIQASRAARVTPYDYQWWIRQFRSIEGRPDRDEIARKACPKITTAEADGPLPPPPPPPPPGTLWEWCPKGFYGCGVGSYADGTFSAFCDTEGISDAATLDEMRDLYDHLRSLFDPDKETPE